MTKYFQLKSVNKKNKDKWVLISCVHHLPLFGVYYSVSCGY